VNEMFLRFYNQTDEKIDECIEKLKQNATGLINVEKQPLTLSVNPLLPQGNHTEVKLTFDTPQNEKSFHDDTKNHQIYMQYCTGKELKKYPQHFELREEKDLVFNHGGGN